jgi:UPF0716 protein FxsA
MPVIVLFVFIAVPITEIAVFIQAGDQFGLWPTIAIVILTALLGTVLLRYQGLRTLGRVQESLQEGEVPVGEVFAGLCLLIAGALLLTPGFLTDTLGFALFVPSIRGFLAGNVLRLLLKRKKKAWADGLDGFNASGPQAHQSDKNVIDVDFTEVIENPRKIGTPDENNGMKK